MPTHAMRFTALPAGIDAEGRARVSAHAGFRLDPGAVDATLADFPAALDWPSTAIDWTVTFRRGDAEVSFPAVSPVEQRDPAWWSAIFRADRPVRSWAPDPGRAGRKVRTLRTARLARRWRDTYAQLGAAPDPSGERPAVGDDPATGALAGFEAAGLWSGERTKDFSDESLLDEMETALATQGAVPADLPGSAAAIARRDVLELRRFLRRAVDDSPVRAPALDFHELTTACSAHPGLLRPLGFVFDLVVADGWPSVVQELGGFPELVAVTGTPSAPVAVEGDTTGDGTAAETVVQEPSGVGGLPGEDDDDGFVPIEEVPIEEVPIEEGPIEEGPIEETTPIDPGETTSPARSAFVADPSPWTRCQADATTFALAVDPQGDLSSSLLARLGDPGRFEPVILDVESATLGAVSLGGTLQLMAARRSRTTPTREAPPALRATGIAIARRDRALTFRQRALERGGLLAAKLWGPGAVPGEAPLDADDLIRGWRLDVRAEGGRWRSLVRRVGRVEVLDATGWDLDDAEGWIAEAPGADAAGDLYLGEEVVRWNGWSPVAPKPGNVIGTDDRLDGRDRADALPDLPVVVSYRPTPGTLVPLRYGRRYQLRLRAVDLAGNGPGPDLDDDVDASPPVLFGRLDPVRSPDLLLTAPRLPGEEVDRVVLRSAWWDRPAADTGEAVAARHLLPPRTTVVEAERHGELDDATGRPDPARYATLAARDAYATQLDPAGREDPDDPRPGDEGTSRWFPLVADGRLRLDAPAALPVGYLPDPLARAVEILKLDGEPLVPGTEGTGLPVGGPTWPDGWRSLRLVVVESTSGITVGWDPDEGLVRVGLPKAETLRLRVSSRFSGDDLGRFALAEWLAGAVLGQDPPPWPSWVDQLRASTVGRRVIAGRHWMFTPWRPLTLVHAVKQPLTDPKLEDGPFSAIDRQLGATASQLGFLSRWHGTSTGRLDLLASWDEGIDLGPGTAAPEIRRLEAVVAELPRDGAGAPDTDGAVSASHRPLHEHGDTKHRRFSYSLEATSAFTDHFVERSEVQLPTDGSSAAIPAVVVPGTVTLTRPGLDEAGEPTSTTYARDDGDGGDYRVIVDPVDGASKLVRVGDAVPLGEPLVARYVTRPISRRSDPVVVRDVRASARPAIPSIHSVLPTFGWTDRRDGATVTSTRTTAGVRVWLDRPWWSSGLGEQLAVLYLPGTAQPADSASPHVTRWGRDPIHATGSVRGALTDAAFPLRNGGSVGLRPPGGPIVRAVPHDVVYDPERDLWRCDIDLALGSYWPFVRLALARLQPNAIVAADPPGGPGDTTIGLSPVALADVVQLAPDRVATVSGSRFGFLRRLTVSVVGPSYTTTTVDTAAPIVEATLERQPLSATSDVDWEVVTGPVPLVREAFPLPAGDQFVKRHRWSGSVLFSPIGTRTHRYRLVVEEHERYRTDGAVADRRIVRVGNRSLALPQPRDGRRLVYADVIPIAPEQLT